MSAGNCRRSTRTTRSARRPAEPEDLAVRDTVRGWAADRVLPHVARVVRARRAARHPRAGPGTRRPRRAGHVADRVRLRAAPPPSQYGLACLELEAADSGIRSLVSVQGSLAMFAIHRFGSEEQKQRVAAAAWPPARSSAASGSPNPTRLRPGAHAHPRQPDGSDWILNGRKMWITNGSVADVAVVWARTDDGHPRLRRPHRHPRVLRPRDQAQVVAARLGHQRAGPRRRAAARRRACCPRPPGCAAR